MYKFENILICLDLTEMDDFLIRYANFIAEKMQPSNVTFLHVMHGPEEMPEEILKEFPELSEPLPDIIREEVQEKVDKLFTTNGKVSKSVVVEDGITSDIILRYTRERNISLTIMGKKSGYNGEGVVPRRVMPLTTSSILLISETAKLNIENVLVRMDFSKIAEITLRMALEISKQTGAEISCHHAAHLPLKYFPKYSVSDQKRLKEKLAGHSQKEYSKFMKRLKLDPEEIPCEYNFINQYDEARLLYHHALTNSFDLIMIGSKIKSELTNVLLDRTSEDLAEVQKNIPVLVVKDRKQTLGFFEALFD